MQNTARSHCKSINQYSFNEQKET